MSAAAILDFAQKVIIQPPIDIG